MIQSTIRRSVMNQVNIKAFTVLWLIYSTQGRFISLKDPIRAEETINREISEVLQGQNRGWFDNSDRKMEVRDPRLSELEWSTYNVREPNGPGTFAFGYDNAVDSAGNEHYRSEERFQNGTVVGEYGYTDYGIKRIVHVTYTADHRGYRAKTEFLPLKDLSSRNQMPGSSYETNTGGRI